MSSIANDFYDKAQELIENEKMKFSSNILDENYKIEKIDGIQEARKDIIRELTLDQDETISMSNFITSAPKIIEEAIKIRSTNDTGKINGRIICLQTAVSFCRERTSAIAANYMKSKEQHTSK